MQEHHVCNDIRLNCLMLLLVVADAVNSKGHYTSAGPAAMPLSTEAPMKLLYVLALALQIALPKQIKRDARYTGRRPKDVLSGTLTSG